MRIYAPQAKSAHITFFTNHVRIWPRLHGLPITLHDDVMKVVQHRLLLVAGSLGPQRVDKAAEAVAVEMCARVEGIWVSSLT